jgi:transposase-like protein
MSWSEADKATTLAVLAANAGNLTKTARQVGIPKATILHWRNGQRVNPDTLRKADQKKRDMADMFEELARAALPVALKDLPNASASQATTIAAIAIDKARLLREQPTTINQTTVISEQEREAAATKVDEILDRVRARKALMTTFGVAKGESRDSKGESRDSKGEARDSKGEAGDSKGETRTG